MARPGESGSPYSYGLMNIYVFAPLPAAAGQYSFQVKATSDVPQKTTIPMQINPCVPRTTCRCQTFAARSPTMRGKSGLRRLRSGVCSNSYRCPFGSSYNTASNSVSRTRAGG
jgi:hypothetical protein